MVPGRWRGSERPRHFTCMRKPSATGEGGPARIRTFILLAAITGFAACARTEDRTAPVADARASLVAAERAWADSSAGGLMVDALVHVLHDEGMLIGGPETPPRGPAGVRERLLSDSALAGARISWNTVRVDVSADGNDGYSFGYLETTLADGIRVPGKYSAYWRRAADGRWQLLAFRHGRRPEGAVADSAPAGFGTPTHERYPLHAPASMDALRDSVAANERAFSDLAQQVGPGEAFRAFVAPDGVNFGGQPEFAWGPDAAFALFADFPEDRGFSWEPDIVDVAGSGDLALSTGPVTALTRRPDGTLESRPGGRYFSVWRRQPDGSWKFVVDG